MAAATTHADVEEMAKGEDGVVANVPFGRMRGGERSAPDMPDDSSPE